jgi:trimeric autotransporter adhesin
VLVSNHKIFAYAGYSTSPGGFSGDNGPATSAELCSPVGLAFDSSGNLYIADSANARVRVVYASGAIPNVSSPTAGYIYTVAGNGTAGFSGDGASATSGKLDYPSGVAVDPSGNLYIADTDNQRIRLVVASTGYISTIAGDGTSGFSGDGGAATIAEMGQSGYSGVPAVAVDSSYNFYIADETNNRIRSVGAVE